MYYVDRDTQAKVITAIVEETGVIKPEFFKKRRDDRYLDGVTAFVSVFHELGASVDTLAVCIGRSRASIHRLIRRHAKIVDTDSRYRRLHKIAKAVAEEVMI